MTWMQQFFGIDAAAEVRKGLTLSGILLLGWMLIQFTIAPINADAGIDANVSFTQAPDQDAVVVGTNDVVATGQTVSGLRIMTIGLEATDSGVPSIPGEAGKTATYALGTTSGQIPLTWDSKTMTPYNGTYRLVATADSVLGEKATAYVTSLKVNNPPATPSGVDAKLESGAVIASWTPNLEPDLIGYRVSRVAGAIRTDMGLVRTASLKDDSAPKGVALRYEVTALRQSPISPDGVASGLAQSSAVTIPLPAVEKLVSTPDTVPDLKPATAAAPVEAKPETVIAPNRNVGFEEYLPYEQPIPLRAESPIDGPVEEISFPQSSSSAMTPRRVELIKYLAASNLLLVGALHTARMARRILVSI